MFLYISPHQLVSIWKLELCSRQGDDVAQGYIDNTQLMPKEADAGFAFTASQFLIQLQQ